MISALAELVRAPAALSVPGDVIAGAAAAGTLGGATAGMAAASVCLYWAGMAANDWADRDLDATERPERPIPSGRVPAPVALGVAAGLTGAGLIVAARSGGAKGLAVATALAAAVWTYDLHLKNTAAGPVGMATCRALDVAMGACESPVRAIVPALTVGAHTYLVTALSRHEVAGAPGRLLPAAAVATTGTLAVTVARTPVAGMLAGQYALANGRPQAALFTDPATATVRRAVGAGITVLPFLQGALTARAGNAVAGLAVAAAAPLARLLSRRISPT